MKAKQQGLSTTAVILLYCFYNLSYAILSPYLGTLSDRVPRKKVMMLGLFIFTMVYLGFSFASELWQFCFLFGLYGIYMAATDGVTKALTVDLVPSELKATALGTLGTVTGIATVLASTLAGVIWDQMGSKWVFVYGAAGALFCLLLLYTNKEADKGPTKKI